MNVYATETSFKMEVAQKSMIIKRTRSLCMKVPRAQLNKNLYSREAE
jgi:hypothetical protein